MPSMSYDTARDSERPYGRLCAKLEELEDYSYKAVLQFPRIERYALCAEIRQTLSMCQRYTVVAWKIRTSKKSTLDKLDVEVEVFRSLIRKSLRLGYITPKKYQVWASHIDEVGRMIGGWIRGLK